MKFLNPDPSRYVVKIRKGKPILVDKQIIRWRKRREKQLADKKAEQEQEIQENPTLIKFFE